MHFYFLKFAWVVIYFICFVYLYLFCYYFLVIFILTVLCLNIIICQESTKLLTQEKNKVYTYFYLVIGVDCNHWIHSTIKKYFKSVNSNKFNFKKNVLMFDQIKLSPGHPRILQVMLMGLLRFTSLLDDNKPCDPRERIKSLLLLNA